MGNPLLLLFPHGAYRAGPFMQAARELPVPVIVGSDHATVLPNDNFIELDFADPAVSLERLNQFKQHRLAGRTFAGVFGVDEATSQFAALVAESFGMPGNPPRSVETLHDKLGFRKWLARTDLPCPSFFEVHPGTPPPTNGYPWVVKPRALSASRGVIRVDTPDEFDAATQRIRALLARLKRRGPWATLDQTLIAESFIVGPEIAVEGLVVNGRFAPFAVFDKPGMSDGPTFPETLYVTPSKRSASEIDVCVTAIQAIVDGLALRTGPLHAEFRCPTTGPVLLEIAARPIGGHCASVLRAESGQTYESLLLHQALDSPLPSITREPNAVGIWMLHIPRSGTLAALRGRETALGVPGITDVSFTKAIGQPVECLPDGEAYLGFLFACGPKRDGVEQALVRAAQHIGVDIETHRYAALER